MNKYEQYEFMKSQWINDNPNATREEYEMFIINLSNLLQV